MIRCNTCKYWIDQIFLSETTELPVGVYKACRLESLAAIYGQFSVTDSQGRQVDECRFYIEVEEEDEDEV